MSSPPAVAGLTPMKIEDVDDRSSGAIANELDGTPARASGAVQVSLGAKSPNANEQVGGSSSSTSSPDVMAGSPAKNISKDTGASRSRVKKTPEYYRVLWKWAGHCVLYKRKDFIIYKDFYFKG